MSYRMGVDRVLSEWCDQFGIEFSTDHCDAFCITDPDKPYVWLYLFYDEDRTIESYIEEINSIYRISTIGDI